MTGDQQSVDVNFNRPFKSKFRPILARLKKKRRGMDESNPQVDNTSSGNSAAYKWKAVVIEGIINAYKEIPEVQIEKGWTKAGKYVYEDKDKPYDGSGYYLAWAPKLMLKLDMPQEYCFTKVEVVVYRTLEGIYDSFPRLEGRRNRPKRKVQTWILKIWRKALKRLRHPLNSFQNMVPWTVFR